MVPQACSVNWGKGEKASRPELEALKQRLWVIFVFVSFTKDDYAGEFTNWSNFMKTMLA